ncbi:MAG: type II toxin-antitoxin system RelE/ParE family toxin [Oscillospiraceae bacterium]|nr:type II toxin-antitoxin system RelE/ParE family toxin [Oscillospiraceae bacterium]
MNYNIRIMSPAKKDIREIHRYISEEYCNSTAATRRVILIYNKIQSLSQNPARFPLVQDDFLSAKGIRVTSAETQKIFYIIREEIKTVSVIRILHGRRDWLRILKQDDDYIE